MSARLMIQCFVLLSTLLISTSAYSAAPDSFKFHVDRFQFEGFIPIDIALVDSTLEPFQNQEHTLESLLEVSKTLEAVIREQGYAFYRVVLPQQPLGKQATIILKVVAFTLGDISIEDNQFFDDENVLRSLPGLVIGKSPNTEVLARALKVAIHHPLKDLRLTFKQAKSENEINATVNVTDAEPDNFAVILANTGNSATGYYRLTGSYQHTNLFNQDHILNISYTTSPGHFKDVKQYGGSYSAPLYSQDAWLTGYWVQSDVNTGTVGALDISGAGTMMGLHYLKNIERFGVYEHWLDIGFDNKIFENNILSGAISLIPDVRSAPVSIMYKAEFPWKENKFDFYLQATSNTGMGSDNDQAAYDGNRDNAERNWHHFRYGMTVNRHFKGWGLRGVFSGQYANEPLISGEQFGLGGSASVRGYEEREIGKDVGYSIKLEATSPKYKDANYVGFFDYGSGRSQDFQPGDPAKSQNIASIGAGVRWQYEKKMLVSFDLAHVLKDGASGQTRSGDNRLHGTVMINF